MNPDRKVERALRVVPREARDRYSAEWRSDLAAAPDEGLAGRDIAKGAWRLAWQLRRRWLGDLLLGKLGPGRAVAAWGGFVLMTAAGALLGSVVLLAWVCVLVAVVVVLSQAGSPSRVSYWLVVASLVAWLGGFLFFGFTFGPAVDAADANVDPPWFVSLGTPALLVSLVGFVGFCVSVTLAAVRGSNRSRLEATPYGEQGGGSR